MFYISTVTNMWFKANISIYSTQPNVLLKGLGEEGTIPHKLEKPAINMVYLGPVYYIVHWAHTLIRFSMVLRWCHLVD